MAIPQHGWRCCRGFPRLNMMVMKFQRLVIISHVHRRRRRSSGTLDTPLRPNRDSGVYCPQSRIVTAMIHLREKHKAGTPDAAVRRKNTRSKPARSAALRSTGAPPDAADGAPPARRPTALPRAKHDALTRELLRRCAAPLRGRSQEEVYFIRDRLHERCAFFRAWPPPLQAMLCRLATARCVGTLNGACCVRPRRCGGAAARACVHACVCVRAAWARVSVQLSRLPQPVSPHVRHAACGNSQVAPTPPHRPPAPTRTARRWAASEVLIGSGGRYGGRGRGDQLRRLC